MASVYIETTIPSFYFETRSSPRVVAWREATRLWWTRYRQDYELVTSEFVLNEMAAGPEEKARRGLSLLADIEVLPEHPRIAETIEAYVRHRVMPADARGDAAHLAMASLHRIDFLLTWNCRHLANANKTGHIRKINQKLGLFSPDLTTPFGLTPEFEP